MQTMRILAWPAYANAKHNPYNALLYKNMDQIGIMEYSHKAALLKAYDVLHVHWPDGYINQKGFFKTLRRMMILFTVVTLAKLKRARIVWTVHNLLPHDAFHPWMATRFLEWFALQTDGLIFLSHSSMQVYRDKYGIAPRQQAEIIPHGHYRSVHDVQIGRQQARAVLGLPQDKKVVLFLGLIKPYKNVDRLITDFIALNDPDSVLLVAGSAEEGLATRLHTLAHGHDNIRLFLEFIPDEKLGAFYGSADVVVLPFRAILNSGSALLSLSYNRKIIAPALGSLVELRDAVGAQWMTTYEGEFGKQTLQDALAAPRPEGECNLDAFDWHGLSSRTRDFYRRLAA
jgi:glycosyltransferase involved in cell wall biosynthesis